MTGKELGAQRVYPLKEPTGDGYMQHLGMSLRQHFAGLMEVPQDLSESLAAALELGEPDDRIHKCPPGPDRHNIRSATPAGFARAVFEANCNVREAA